MSKKDVLFSGFMLFSLFFGAGNLIFPPILGFESGDHFGLAITGFLITAVLLPFLAIMAIALSDNGLISIGNRVNKVFGLVFAIIIYMSIGAFYGIPRASNVAYELGFGQVAATDGRLSLYIFSVLFFGATYFISYNPKKIVDRIGQILTPVLLLVLAVLFIQSFITFENIASPALDAYNTAPFLIFGATYFISYNPKKIVDRIGQILTPVLLLVLAVLFIQSFITFENNASPAVDAYDTAPFLNGFLEGYFTMDAVAALAFGIVVINSLKDKGAKTKSELVKGSAGAGILAGLGLIVVYFCLGWIGRVIPEEVDFTNGADILTEGSSLLFVRGGSLLFGVIVILACLTTCVGLINACSRFFNEIYPKLSYEIYVALFVLIGLLVSNLGLDVILQLATPLLVFIYPISIVLVILSLFQYVAGGGKLMYQLSVIVTSIYALYEVLASVGVEFNILKQALGIAPFFQHGLGWVLPAFIAACIGYGMDKFKVSRD